MIKHENYHFGGNETMSKTLKEIYEYDLIEDDGIDYTVDEWFNTIMEKTKDQLSVADVSRMLRQRICSRIAIKRAIEMLSDDPFIGEMFEGQLMFNLLSVSLPILFKVKVSETVLYSDGTCAGKGRAYG